jgi:hypothetical protein
VLYSRHDRNKDQELVGRLYDEFKKLVPSPKWKLVVDIGKANSAHQLAAPAQPNPSTLAGVKNFNTNLQESAAAGGRDPRIDELVALLGEQMPHDPHSPYSTYLQGFMSLRLMLLKPTRTSEEKELEGTLLSSYSSYKSSGRDNSDIAVMIARDFMFLQQQHQPQVQPQAQPLHSGPPQAGGNFYQAPPQQQGSMDASNHSVIGLGRQPHVDTTGQRGIPDVSNHSHIQLGHSQPYPGGSHPGQHHGMQNNHPNIQH